MVHVRAMNLGGAQKSYAPTCGRCGPKHHVEPIVVDYIVSHNHDHVYFYSNSIIAKMNNDDNNNNKNK